MLEFLQNFEQASAKFAPLILIIPGVIAVVLGLIIWLRGLSFRRLLAGIIGAIIGAILGFLLFSQNIVTTAIAICVCALIAIIFQRLIITLLLASLATVICFIILSAPYMTTADEAYSDQLQTTMEQDSTMSVQESVQAIETYAAAFLEIVKKACWEMPLYKWVIIAIPLVLLIAPGLIFWRLASSLFFAAIGTLLIFAGMISLLLFKGTAAISGIAERSSFYGIICIVMLTFGTLEQFVLCRDTKKQPKGKRPADSGNQGQQKEKQNWRTK
jgi:hypothetical protein